MMVIKLQWFGPQKLLRLSWCFKPTYYMASLTVQAQSTHTKYFSERNGFVKWYYLWPLCWNYRKEKKV